MQIDIVIKVIFVLAVLSIIIACINEKYIESRSHSELTVIYLLIPSVIVDAFLASNGVEALILLLPLWIIHIELSIIYDFLYKTYNDHKMNRLNKINGIQNEIKRFINNIKLNNDEYNKLIQKEE